MKTYIKCAKLNIFVYNFIVIELSNMRTRKRGSRAMCTIRIFFMSHACHDNIENVFLAYGERLERAIRIHKITDREASTVKRLSNGNSTAKEIRTNRKTALLARRNETIKK